MHEVDHSPLVPRLRMRRAIPLLALCLLGVGGMRNLRMSLWIGFNKILLRKNYIKFTESIRF